MPDILEAITSYNPTAFVQGNQQREANIADTQAQIAQRKAQDQLAQQQAREAELKNQAAEREAKDQAILQEAWRQSDGDPNRLVKGVIQKGGSPRAVLGLQESLIKQAKERSLATFEQNKVRAQEHERAAALFEAAAAAPAGQEQAAWELTRQAAIQEGLATPQELPAQFPGKEWVQMHRNGAVVAGTLAKEAAAKQEADIKKQEADQKAALAVPQLQQAQNAAITGKPNAEGLTPNQVREAQQAKDTLNKPAQLIPGRDIPLPAAVEAQRIKMAEAEAKARLKDPSPKEPRPLPATAVKSLEKAANQFDQMDRLNNTFQDAFVGNTLTGGIENALGRVGGESLGITDKGQTEWWQDYQGYVNQVRHELFGSALTAGEREQFEKAIITPRTDPKIARENLKRQHAIVQNSLARTANVYKKGGYNPDQISEFVPEGVGRVDVSGRADAASGSIPTPTTQSAYDALPKGAKFLKPNDSKVYIKQ